MDERLRVLLDQAIYIEKKSYYKKAQWHDGSPYQCYASGWEFLEQVFDLVEKAEILELVNARKEDEERADPGCANWVLWTVLNQMDVSRERK